MTDEELRDEAKAFADEIQAHEGSRRRMPDELNERFRRIVASFRELYPVSKQLRDWKDLPTGQAFNYAQAYKWARKIQDFCNMQVATEQVHPIRIV